MGVIVRHAADYLYHSRADGCVKDIVLSEKAKGSTTLDQELLQESGNPRGLTANSGAFEIEVQRIKVL